MNISVISHEMAEDNRLVGRYALPGYLPSASLIAIVATSILAVYFGLSFLYNRYFHPLAQFPGPAAAANSTRWLYKVSMTGRAEEIFEKLHAKYETKALRIAPNELHISDVDLYNVIYSQANPFPKYEKFYEAFQLPHAVFAETDPELHKERRGLISSYFSRTALFKRENLFHDRVAALMHKIRHLSKTQTIVNVPNALMTTSNRCFAFDVQARATFGYYSDLINEEKDTFGCGIQRASDGIGGIFWKNFEWPILKAISRWNPTPVFAHYVDIFSFAGLCLEKYESRGKSSSDPSPEPVLFDFLASIPSEERVIEAVDLLFAGSDTIASTTSSGVLAILSDPQVHRKLVDELKNVQPDENGELPLLELEKLDYLVACVKESIRIGMGVPGRLPRLVPENLNQPFIVDGKLVPSGTVVSISAYTMNYSEELWGPDAKAFNPDRWLQSNSKSLNQYLCSFSKGRRQCLGQNVAHAELLVLMGYLFKNFHLKFPPNFQVPQRMDWFAMKFYELPILFEAI